MKKILCSILFLLSFSLYGNEEIAKWYESYPFPNPYDATIIGSSMIMTPGVSKKVPKKNYEIVTKEQGELPENLWNHNKFRFSLVKQKNKAPLIFLLAGTGSDYNSGRMELFQRILYDAGFHVISISSQMTVNFIASASKFHLPGLLEEDSRDMYEIMKKAYQSVKKEIEVTNFFLTGYSLGATNAAFLSKLDEEEQFFNFKRVFMVNPAVNLYSSARQLDKYLNQVTKNDVRNLEKMLEAFLMKLKEEAKNEYIGLSSENIYKYFQGNQFSDIQKAALVGLAFRINAVDLNYVSDLLAKTGVYTKVDEHIKKFSPMLSYFAKIKFADFGTYVDKIALPYYRKKLGIHYSKEELIAGSSLQGIEEYLKNSPKIVAVTNEDELILSKEDFAFLRNTMGNRIFIYPKGGHCGNMFYTPNVKVMLEFLKEGVFVNEK
ncbi:MAG: serine/threonine protein kinase [Fusobacterium necrophorum]|nr:serine/threonine protein kinase [Fusobacterium necrophorum]MDY6172822.1 serine/threonine protein kinase [Fusobacterium necrophorum]